MAALADPGELGFHLQRTDLDPSAAAQALLLASGAVQAYCGWEIAETTGTLQVEGTGTRVLTLPVLNLTDITEIRVDGVALDLTDTVYVVNWTKKGQVMRLGGWPAWCTVEVDCTYGFTPVPDVIKLIVLEQAAKQMANPEGLLSATTSSVSRTWAGAGKPKLSALDERLLLRYAI